MDAPETTPVQVQANPLQEAMAEARAEIESRAPQSPPDIGTGTDSAVESAPSPDQQAPTPEVDWTNPEAREAYLNEKYISTEEHERRKENQLRSLKGELDLARQAREQQKRDSLLAELDELAEVDPTAYVERINRNPEEAALIVERASRISPDLLQRASVNVATGLAERLFAVRPELEALAGEGGEKWLEVVNPETGGPFGYVQRTAFSEGEQAGIEKFKQSAEYKNAIAEAERRGAHDAFGGLTVETPSPETASAFTPNSRPKFDNDLQEAAWEASQELQRTTGRRPNVDLRKVGSARSGMR